MLHGWRTDFRRQGQSDAAVAKECHSVGHVANHSQLLPLRAEQTLKLHKNAELHKLGPQHGIAAGVVDQRHYRRRHRPQKLTARIQVQYEIKDIS